ncbi:hypothetical protein COO60DRAFT_1465293 [Scenedesmus sp. NREL 46B-D3]|nr:hypothetical protein COO60DRAFT_1465293 [Scenedesmus sp. NREL 46B-D3]
MTLHSFAGIKDFEKPKVKLAEGLWSWDQFLQSWRQTDVLLVDEVSMVDCETLEKVDYVARYLRGWRLQLTSLPGLQGIKEVHELHPEPFGGMQVIAVGDFYQLPPVIKQAERVIDPDRPQQNSSGTPGRSGSGGRTPGRADVSGRGASGGSGRSAAGSGGSFGKDVGAGGSSAQKKRKAPPADVDSDDKEAPAKVPVIMAALPTGYVTLTAAERAEWSMRARAQAAVTAAAAASASATDGAGAARSNAVSAAAAAAAGYPAAYCFKSPAWAAAGLKPVVLRQPFRQSEPELLRMLEGVRHGLFSAHTRQMLTDLQRPLPTDDGIEPTELFTINKLVDVKNEESYAKLTGPELKLRCIDRCRLFEADRVADPDPGLLSADRLALSLDDSTNAQQQLKVKPLAQVVLLWNLDVAGGLANGTRGVVQRFASVSEYLRQLTLAAAVQWQCCEPQAGRCGDPLCPCSQGCWGKQQPGQRRVRLPEVPQGLTVKVSEGMPPWRRRQLQEALVWINHTGTLQLPLVRFQLPPREASNPFAAPRGLIIGPQTYSLTSVWPLQLAATLGMRCAFAHPPAAAAAGAVCPLHIWRVKVRSDSEELRLTRTALPLRLAWALTVHRSQGMSLGKLKVHLQRAFAAGMVYVGLSRCTSLAGLQVVGEVKPPQCDEDVRRLYKFIEQEEAWLAAQGS